MKVCVSSSGKEKSSNVDFRFGRCSYFAIYDSENAEFKALENAGIASAQGAGIAAAQQVVDEKVDAVITGNMGPNAMNLLKAAGIKIFGAAGGTVEGAIKLFQENKLESIEKPAPAHSGMGNQKRGW
ncbi:MAG: NifB/NifX family molybdenum-iron cluster-binding protein [Desulfitobacteriaceae bacterium]|nr:NifB/NifX family molybdenum-iron cluster-binding protein [Desulfitobacteriaceae bacterium]MDD4752608.1 NifB/NifX family molybdenum-iron cluster-binding protein [Desulfitobacteriaceae bacterium]